jgi:hypothetical protein
MSKHTNGRSQIHATKCAPPYKGITYIQIIFLLIRIENSNIILILVTSNHPMSCVAQSSNKCSNTFAMAKFNAA